MKKLKVLALHASGPRSATGCSVAVPEDGSRTRRNTTSPTRSSSSATKSARSACRTSCIPSATRSTSSSRTSRSTCSRSSRATCCYDQNVVSLLELLRVPYTGCNPRGLILSREKALSKNCWSFTASGYRRSTPSAMGLKVKRPREPRVPADREEPAPNTHRSAFRRRRSCTIDAELEERVEVRAPPREDRRDRRAVHRRPRGVRRACSATSG